MRVLTVIGARPQFIKAAPVSRALAMERGIDEVLVHTGQHFDANMSDIFFEELRIPAPAHHLGLGGGTHGQNTGRMIEGLERAMVDERPDWILLYGDTDSTLAGAIAASKLHIRIAHVEAGLRSFNMAMPEEINRRLTDHVSSLLFCPTSQGVVNLAREGIDGARVAQVGDVMYDASLMFSGVVKDPDAVLDRFRVGRGQYILATVHRQENTDDPQRLAAILDAFAQASVPVLMPLHPRTRSRLASFGMEAPSNIIVTDPLGYLDMVVLQRGAQLIATDSGGMQKEAYFHRVPCVTLRDETEWVELVEMGWNRLARPGTDDLASALQGRPGPGVESASPYGDGHASVAIASMLAAAA